MTDHKFEPFQQVLVRDNNEWPWEPAFFWKINADAMFQYCTVCGRDRFYCIPYTPETAHLLGTSQPYEPPKPPQEYEWGEVIQVFQNGEWVKAIFIDSYISNCFDGNGAIAMPIGKVCASNYPPDRIRPLPDDTAAHADD